MTLAWRCISGGCHLNRPVCSMIEATRFRIDQVETGYMPRLKPTAFMLEGRAQSK